MKKYDFYLEPLFPFLFLNPKGFQKGFEMSYCLFLNSNGNSVKTIKLFSEIGRWLYSIIVSSVCWRTQCGHGKSNKLTRHGKNCYSMNVYHLYMSEINQSQILGTQNWKDEKEWFKKSKKDRCCKVIFQNNWTKCHVCLLYCKSSQNAEMKKRHFQYCTINNDKYFLIFFLFYLRSSNRGAEKRIFFFEFCRIWD